MLNFSEQDSANARLDQTHGCQHLERLAHAAATNAEPLNQFILRRQALPRFGIRREDAALEPVERLIFNGSYLFHLLPGSGARGGEDSIADKLRFVAIAKIRDKFRIPFDPV